MHDNCQPPDNNCLSVWQTSLQGHIHEQFSETPYPAASTPPIYPVTPRPVPQFYHQTGFYVSPPITAQQPPHSRYYRLFTFPDATPPCIPGQFLAVLDSTHASIPGMSKHVIDTKSTKQDSIAPNSIPEAPKRPIDTESTECNTVVPPTKKLRQIDFSGKENQ